jgi:VIT1/CCC1 family predicted Fe2+/Mn2+ transporter
MEKQQLEGKELKVFLKFQQDECNAVEIYRRLGEMTKHEHNKGILMRMSKEEATHYEYIKRFTDVSMTYNKMKVMTIVIMAKIFGLMFTLKRLEKDEASGVADYTHIKELETFAKTEEEHEQEILDMIDESFLKYMGSIVLGLNDALVEFTGALAGYTLALGSCSLVALTGSITGIAAALSMGSSEYLSTKSDGNTTHHALASAFYTSAAYLVTVFLLIAPYIWIPQPVTASVLMLCIAIVIIALFNYYYAIVRNEKFSHRFGEMALISFSVAVLSFVIGYLLKEFTGIEG